MKTKHGCVFTHLAQYQRKTYIVTYSIMFWGCREIVFMYRLISEQIIPKKNNVKNMVWRNELYIVHTTGYHLQAL